MLIDDYITSGKYNLGTLRLDLCISLRVIFEDLLLLLLFIFLKRERGGERGRQRER